MPYNFYLSTTVTVLSSIPFLRTIRSSHSPTNTAYIRSVYISSYMTDGHIYTHPPLVPFPLFFFSFFFSLLYYPQIITSTNPLKKTSDTPGLVGGTSFIFLFLCFHVFMFLFLAIFHSSFLIFYSLLVDYLNIHCVRYLLLLCISVAICILYI